MEDVVTTNIKSYVIYDLETTTLPCFGRAKITEISVVAVLRNHIEDQVNISELPRVLNKLTLCVYPQRIIPLESERMTGLSNYLLEEQSPFNEKIFNILNDFIVRLPQPVCLIAHNGSRFDFPILQAEINGLGKKFPDDLLCADSLPAFRELYSGKPIMTVTKISQEITFTKSTLEGEEVQSLFADTVEFDPDLCEILDSIEETVLNQEVSNDNSSDLVEEILHPNTFSSPSNHHCIEKTISSPSNTNDIKRRQKINETTPKRVNHQPSIKAKRLSNSAVSKTELTPETSSYHSDNKRYRRNAPVRCLVDEFGGHRNHPKSYKLVDLFHYICKREPLRSHSAEDDAIMLLYCIIASREGFLKWVDRNAIIFNNVRKMW